MTHPENTSASSDSNCRRPLAPDIRRLDERSARAWTEAMAVRPVGEGRYVVESQSGAEYLVDLPKGDCSCPDHEIRGERCKHIRRVAIEVTERRVPAPGMTEDDCTVCGHRSFVAEVGPAVCSDCWLDRGEVVTDRETGDTVVVVRLANETAAERYIDAADCTVADYPKNDGYPDEDPVVEVVYPFSGDREADQRKASKRASGDTETASREADLEERARYAFPYSRLSTRDRTVEA